jgi:hypothetical protein
MKTPTHSFDQYRRQIRHQLFIKRQQEKDNSEARLFLDAQKLDAQLIIIGYALVYPTEWSRKRKPRYLEADISDLNSKDICEAGNG